MNQGTLNSKGKQAHKDAITDVAFWVKLVAALLAITVVQKLTMPGQMEYLWLIAGIPFALLALVLCIVGIAVLVDKYSPNGDRALLKKLDETKQPEEYIVAMQKKLRKAQKKKKSPNAIVYALNTVHGFVCNAEFERAKEMLDTIDLSKASSNMYFIYYQHRVSIAIYEENYEEAGAYLPELFVYQEKMVGVQKELQEFLEVETKLWECFCERQYEKAVHVLDELERLNKNMDVSYLLMYRMRLAFYMGDEEKGRELFQKIAERKNMPVIHKMLEKYREKCI